MEDTTRDLIGQQIIPEQTDFKLEIYPMGKSKIFGALSKFQGKCTHPKKTATNPFFKSKYAPLDSCISANQPLLAECGLAVLQFPITRGGKLGLIGLLTHTDGEYLQSEYFVKPDQKKDPDTGELKEATAQSLGSAITYLRRYHYCAVLALAAEDDDDGNTASGSKLKDNRYTETTSYIKPVQPTQKEEKQNTFAEKRTLTKNEIQEKLKSLNTAEEQRKLWFLLTESQQNNPETEGWFTSKKAQMLSALKELEKEAKEKALGNLKDTGKPNNEKGIEMFSSDVPSDGMRFINAIRELKNADDLQVFNDMYTEAVMKLPAEQYKMVAMELDQLEAKFNQGE